MEDETAYSTNICNSLIMLTDLVNKLLSDFEATGLLNRITELLLEDDPNTFIVNTCTMDAENGYKFGAVKLVRAYIG